MTQKMIQIDVDVMKKELESLIGYYGSTREIERTIENISSKIDDGKPISAFKLIAKLREQNDEHYANIKRLTTLLTDAGCVLD